jgi:hypothetical protein
LNDFRTGDGFSHHVVTIIGLRPMDFFKFYHDHRPAGDENFFFLILKSKRWLCSRLMAATVPLSIGPNANAQGYASSRRSALDQQSKHESAARNTEHLLFITQANSVAQMYVIDALVRTCQRPSKLALESTELHSITINMKKSLSQIYLSKSHSKQF